MSWTLFAAALVSAICLVVSALLFLWAGGRALPGGRRKGLARHLARTAGARGAPGPALLGALGGVFLLAALIPWGLAAPPEIGRWRFVFPALGGAFLVVFLLHGISTGVVRHGATFARNDRRLFAPLSLVLAAGYAALLAGWFA